LKRSILQFYGDGTSQVAIKRNKKETKAWEKLQDELQKLKAAPTDEQPPTEPAAN
jgi:hypothetical protein